MNTCYHSVQNLPFSSLLSENIKIKIYRTICLSVVLYACETSSFTLREEYRLRVFEERVLRRSNRGVKKKPYNGELYDLYSSPNIIQVIKYNRMRWAGHVACMEVERRIQGFWWGNLREIAHAEDPSVHTILRWIFRKWDVGLWTGLSWFRIGIVGGLY